ncbi:MAG: hypothetical protein U0414_04920 [Polyangiaceae bacterium]
MPSRSTAVSLFRGTGHAKFSKSGRSSFTAFRAFWVDLCATEAFSGRWVAVDAVSYRPHADEPHEVEVVDADDDLTALVSRMRANARTSCSVLQCKRKHAERPRYRA